MTPGNGRFMRVIDESKLGLSSVISGTPSAQNAEKILLNSGTLAKARKCVLNDIMTECTLDRFQIDRHFGTSEIDTYIQSGNFTKGLSAYEKILKRNKAMEEPPSPLRPTEMAKSFDPKNYKLKLPKPSNNEKVTKRNHLSITEMDIEKYKNLVTQKYLSPQQRMASVGGS